MSYHRLFRPSVLLLVLLTISSTRLSAQPIQVPLADSIAAPKATIVRLKPNGIKVPKGGHLQGIQCLNGSILIISASSGSYSYYLTAHFNSSTGKGRLTAIHKISDGPFRHAGGCQLYGQTLAVGIEDNISKNKSDILLISLDERGNETSRKVVAYRAGQVKRSTAGAVGFTQLISGQYIIVVGDWDSKNLDIYLSKPGIDSVFDSLTTVHITDLKNVPSYQAINLFCDLNGNVHLAGFALDGTKNRLDEFMLLIKSGNAKLTNISTHTYMCKGGAGFRFASGIDFQSKYKPSFYTCSRGTRPFTTINIFTRHKL